MEVGKAPGRKEGVSRVLPVGRWVYWGFWEASQKLPAKREFLGTSVEEKRLPVMVGRGGPKTAGL